jgi:putative ABC transport system permease protein
VRALDRKLLRDLASLKAQVVSIALVIACGIGGFIGTMSTHDSLVQSRERYYDEARFPHLFATAKRAPRSLEERLRAIPGVSEVELRVVQDAQLSIPGVGPPMIAHLIGRDPAHPPEMSRLSIRRGRWPLPGAAHEAVVNERFFEARGLRLGDAVSVLMNGRLQRLTLVGSVLSPEFIYASRGTGMPDDEWYAVLWMDRRALEAAYDMEGAFDSATLRLARGASARRAIAALDAILDPYGGFGAVGREDQVSHKILTQEMDQIRVFGTILPGIFLAVAAFVLNVVMHRQVTAQRPEIAALKALGYGDRTIAAHYLAFASAIALLGTALGVAVGWWLGIELTGLYTDFFQFPRLLYVLSPGVALGATAVALAACFGGAWAATRAVVRLRAAEALRPPAPEAYRPLVAERLGAGGALTPAQRMILRNVERRPGRAAATAAGVAAAVAILVSGIFWKDAIDWFMDIQFNKVQRADVLVGFAEPVERSALRELARLPGVKEAEAARAIPARLEAGPRAYRTALSGLDDDARLLRILDARLKVAHPPPGAVLLTKRLADRLGLRPGDTVWADLLEGRRVKAALVVAGTVDEMAGMNAWMRTADLNRLAREGPVISQASLLVDRRDEPRLLARLKEIPAAAVVIVNRTLLDTFRRTSARNVLFFTTVLTAFAAVIAVGVVYNNARIQLAERAWELATLRVLGFTRAEVSVILLGELALEIAAAIPLGFAGGYGLAALIVRLMKHEVFEFPLVIFPRTYAYAAAIVVGAGIASALLVRHRVDRLDLVGVLKTRE